MAFPGDLEGTLEILMREPFGPMPKNSGFIESPSYQSMVGIIENDVQDLFWPTIVGQFYQATKIANLILSVGEIDSSKVKKNGIGLGPLLCKAAESLDDRIYDPALAAQCSEIFVPSSKKMLNLEEFQFLSEYLGRAMEGLSMISQGRLSRILKKNLVSVFSSVPNWLGGPLVKYAKGIPNRKNRTQFLTAVGLLVQPGRLHDSVEAASILDRCFHIYDALNGLPLHHSMYLEVLELFSHSKNALDDVKNMNRVLVSRAKGNVKIDDALFYIASICIPSEPLIFESKHLTKWANEIVSDIEEGSHWVRKYCGRTMLDMFMGEESGYVRLDYLKAKGGTREVYRGTHSSKGVVAATVYRKNPVESSIALEMMSSLGSRVLSDNEEEILLNLDHPNIVKFYGWANPFPSILSKHIEIKQISKGSVAMSEYVAGRSFEEIISEEFFDDGNYLKYFLGILEAVDYLHSKGLIHRDLRLPNFVWDEEKDRSVLVDFQLAVIEEKLDNFAPNINGGRSYTSPEAHARGEISQLSDIYSVGISMYRALTGEFPIDFTGWSREQIKNYYEQLPEETYRLFIENRLLELPEPVRSVVSSTLNYNPLERPTARKLVELAKQLRP